MQHKDLLKYLIRYGTLSTAFLVRKYKISIEQARKELALLARTYDDVKYKTEDLIYIIGRELESWTPKKYIRKPKAKKPPRWKDVTKP